MLKYNKIYRLNLFWHKILKIYYKSLSFQMQINNNPAFDIVKELEYINRTVVPIDKAKKI